MVYKPGSVSNTIKLRIFYYIDDDYSSEMIVANHLKQPTQV